MANNKYSWENESDKILKRLVSQDDEEFLSKKRARELFDNGILKNRGGRLRLVKKQPARLKIKMVRV